MEKPFAPACERNKQYILEKLQMIFANAKMVLEIGSGTGQHAVYFAQNMPHLTWQPSDLESELLGITTWVKEANLENLMLPLCLDVNIEQWLLEPVDAVFTANTIHIVSETEIKKMFDHIGKILKAKGTFCCYGPFNYNGKFTSESNAQFQKFLEQRYPNGGGIKDMNFLLSSAKENAIELVEDYEMPANNRLLYWQKNNE